LKKSKKTQNEIALEIGISQSTVSRELRRNKGKWAYRYKQAHEKAINRRFTTTGRPKKMTPSLISTIESMLRNDQLSPDQISGRLRTKRIAKISHESIYQHILKDKKMGGDLYKNLRRSGKKYNKRLGKTAGRGLIPNRVDITQRPKEVDAKIRVGDFEGDTIVGAHHKGVIVSIVERKTKMTFLQLLPHAKALDTAQAIIKKLQPIKDFVMTITTDNGKEFANHELVAEKLEAQFFFAQPYHSWERGLNENTNGLVRQYFSKGSDFSKLDEQQVFAVEKKLNNRPRKTLNYRTPNEEFIRLTGANPEKLCIS
jgi:IS30 family transposase